MLATCDASVDIRAFEQALKPILPRSRSAIRSIAFSPSPEGLTIEVCTKRVTGRSTVQKNGPWDRRVVTKGPMLARLAGKLGKGELRLTYACGRLHLNRLSVPANETLP